VQRFLITGASGLLGATFALEAEARGADVTGVFHTHPIVLGRGITQRVDLTNVEGIDALIEEQAPNVVIHCAAATNVDWCEANPGEAHKLNGELPQRLAMAAAKIGATLVYVSTDSVFDGADGGYDEDTTPAPVNVYAASKLEGERGVRESTDRHLVVRTNMFGWGLYKESLAEWIIGCLASGSEVPGFVDVVFSPLLVNDLVELVFELLRRRAHGTFHLASADAHSKFEFARMLARGFGHDEALVRRATIDGAMLKARRPRNTSLNVARVAREIEADLPTLEQGVARFRLLRDSGFIPRLMALKGEVRYAND
jgi:dTDP-4-dehydrorhamnose reductase